MSQRMFFTLICLIISLVNQISSAPTAQSSQSQHQFSLHLASVRRTNPLDTFKDPNVAANNLLTDQFIIQLRSDDTIPSHQKVFLDNFLQRHPFAKLLNTFEIGEFIGYSLKLSDESVTAGVAAVNNSHYGSSKMQQQQQQAALNDLRYSTAIESIEYDQICTASAQQTDAPWNLDRISKRKRSEMNTVYSYPNSGGAGVDVYILDTGVRVTHQQFEGRVTFGASFTAKPITGDPNGHGTGVAGVVASSTYGVAKKANIIAVQVLDATMKAPWSAVLAGLDWTLKSFRAKRRPPSVVNLSLNGPRSVAVDRAVNSLASAGMHITVSAGNENIDACLNSPSNAIHATVVGGSSFDDYKSSKSNFGSCVDIYAPGEFITSPSSGNDQQIDGWYGTSFAAPHVAGVKALLLAQNATWRPVDLNEIIYKNASINMLYGLPKSTVNRFLYTS